MNLILGLVIPGMGKYHKHFYARTSIKIIFQNKNICNTYYLEEFILQPNLIMIIFHTFQIDPKYYLLSYNSYIKSNILRLMYIYIVKNS